jgi:L-threonylcarbamoyladenylate synthase
MEQSAHPERAIRKPDNAAIKQASDLLHAGLAIGLPTETVYGLAADATNDDAVARIFELKGRPQFNPLIVHVASIEMAQTLVAMSPLALQLAAQFWPGPLTMVLPRLPDCPVSLLASAGLDTLAIRMPGHPVAQALLHEAALPLAAPSANISGNISPTTAAHVAAQLALPIILDGGPCTVGVESTILKVDEDGVVLLRPGGIAAEDIEGAIGQSVQPLTKPDKITAPGQMLSHYAPSKPIRLNAVDVAEGEGLLAFGTPLAGANIVANLSATANATEAAANLFAMMHQLDDANCTAIAVMPIPDEGLGQAINDRLGRAAAPRDGGS